MHYKELMVWQKSMNLVEEIYKLTASLPKEEQFGLVNQMRRAAVSIPSNIAEGQSRQSAKEYLHFLSIARGSKAELSTQIEICIRLCYLDATRAQLAISLCEEVGKMLYAQINSLCQTQ